MSLIALPEITDPGVFVYDSESPTQYTEACSHAIHSILRACYVGGYLIQSEELSGMLLHIDRYRGFDSIQVGPLSESIEEG